MSSVQTSPRASERPEAGSSDLRLEVVVVPVQDVDRSIEFYRAMGFRLDVDYVGDPGFRVVQLTPPGSKCSIIIGSGITATAPGSVDGLVLVVYDLEAARDNLIARGIDVSEPFVDQGGVFHHIGTQGRVRGLDPDRRAYRSQASLSDPDGNRWYLQEVKTPAPGR
jgi:catechol 2,3-dioxygenase-like lactoylglutathione lyase family enzyme